MSVKRTILQAVPIPELPGWELRLVQLEFSPGYAVPVHTHPVTGLGFVAEGAMVSQYEGGETRLHGEGDTFLDLSEPLHVRAQNANPDKPLKVVVSYVVKPGEPTTVMV